MIDPQEQTKVCDWQDDES